MRPTVVAVLTTALPLVGPGVDVLRLLVSAEDSGDVEKKLRISAVTSEFRFP